MLLSETTIYRHNITYNGCKSAPAALRIIWRYLQLVVFLKVFVILIYNFARRNEQTTVTINQPGSQRIFGPQLNLVNKIMVFTIAKSGMCKGNYALESLMSKNNKWVNHSLEKWKHEFIIFALQLSFTKPVITEAAKRKKTANFEKRMSVGELVWTARKRKQSSNRNPNLALGIAQKKKKKKSAKVGIDRQILITGFEQLLKSICLHQSRLSFIKLQQEKYVFPKIEW